MKKLKIKENNILKKVIFLKKVNKSKTLLWKNWKRKHNKIEIMTIKKRHKSTVKQRKKSYKNMGEYILKPFGRRKTRKQDNMSEIKIWIWLEN